jgi:hypothetical protein
MLGKWPPKTGAATCCFQVPFHPRLSWGRKVYIRIEFDVVGSSDANDMFSTKKACYCFLSRVV